jgi:hypothetical protein
MHGTGRIDPGWIKAFFFSLKAKLLKSHSRLLSTGLIILRGTGGEPVAHAVALS